jgi:hypothetical protein
MARSALEVINDHIAGGQANLARYRREWQGSGVRVSSASFSEQDRALLRSLLFARDVLDAAQFGPEDPHFQRAVRNWAAFEWGGFWDRDTYTAKERLPRPALPDAFSGELLREHR